MRAWYELSDYITAESLYRERKDFYLQERSEIMALTHPQIDTKLGFMAKASLSVENAIIHFEEAEERFKNDIESFKESRKKLAAALKILTYEEKQVFFNLTLGVPVALSDTFIKKHEKQVVNKLCKYIEMNYLEKGVG